MAHGILNFDKDRERYNSVIDALVAFVLRVAAGGENATPAETSALPEIAKMLIWEYIDGGL